MEIAPSPNGRECYDVLIVGAGHAGAQLAINLRQRQFAGSIGLVSDESDPPYERPPLSKDYLLGDKTWEHIRLRPTDFWAERGITLCLGHAVRELDAKERVVTLADRRRIDYGHLVWATGGRPRRLACAGGDLEGVYAVRTRHDVDRLRADLEMCRRAVVVGAGFIGLEAAAVLRKLGKEVTVLEAAERVLGRVAGEPLSRFFEAEHRANGVDLRLGCSVDHIVGRGARVAGVVVRGGEYIKAEVVIVGIGITPATELLSDAGAQGESGVWVDEHCRTSLPNVFAIGDCAAHPNHFAAGARVRLESVQNANDQATVVAKMLTGEPEPYQAVPWFWSNQYDIRLQTVGLSQSYDDVVVRGCPADRKFSVVYLRDGRVIALDCVNALKDYVQGKALVVAGSRVPKAMLADATTPLKALATAG